MDSSKRYPCIRYNHALRISKKVMTFEEDALLGAGWVKDAFVADVPKVEDMVPMRDAVSQVEALKGILDTAFVQMTEQQTLIQMLTEKVANLEGMIDWSVAIESRIAKLEGSEDKAGKKSKKAEKETLTTAG